MYVPRLFQAAFVCNQFASAGSEKRISVSFFKGFLYKQNVNVFFVT